MEESQFLVWMKRNQIFNSHNDLLLQAPLTAPCNNSKSWEEKAFAADAARILGGCIWPPRSYSCSFCKREFRSAQALGGHMNVHRRDRARLQHHSTNTLQIEPFHNRRHNDSSKSLAAEDKFSAEICCLQDCYNLNPISSLSSSRDRVVDAKVGDQNICVQTDLSVGLNSLFGQKLPTSRSISDCKRAKTAAVSNSLPVLAFESDGIVLGIEDVDLELRLGKPQKI